VPGHPRAHRAGWTVHTPKYSRGRSRRRSAALLGCPRSRRLGVFARISSALAPGRRDSRVFLSADLQSSRHRSSSWARDCRGGTVKGRIAATSTGDASASRSPADDRWLSAKEAAAYIGISTRTLYGCCRSGGLRHARITQTPGGVMRFRRSWLDRWLESRAQGGD
jgi:excisionase family DNA binding protein